MHSRRITGRLCAGRSFAAARQRLNGVAAEIQHGLNDVVRIDLDGRQARVVIALDRDLFGRLAAQQAIHALEKLVHVHELLRRRAPGSQHAIEQVGEPIGLADDDTRVLAQRRIEQLALEQLRGAAQAAQRILDLVRELTNHETAAAELREQRVLAREPPMLRDVLDLEQAVRSRRRRARPR